LFAGWLAVENAVPSPKTVQGLWIRNTQPSSNACACLYAGGNVSEGMISSRGRWQKRIGLWRKWDDESRFLAKGMFAVL